MYFEPLGEDLFSQALSANFDDMWLNPRRHYFRFFLLIYTFLPCLSFGQLPPIGQWRDHLPYQQAMQVTETTDQIWCAALYSIYSIDKDENSIERWSKVNGLSDAGISCIGSAAQSSTLVIAYSNSNIDILTGSVIKNISSIKNSTQPGDKGINQVNVIGNQALLSSNLGIIVLDLSRNEVSNTYIIGSNGGQVKVFATASDNNFLYAATAEGLKRAPINGTNLADYRNWQLISGSNGLPAGPVIDATSLNGQVYIIKNDSLYHNPGSNWNFIYTDGSRIHDLSSSGNKILLSSTLNNTGRVSILNNTGTLDRLIQDANFVRSPKQALLVGGDCMIADSIVGLSRFSNNSFQTYIPNSPSSIATGTMQSANNILLAASGTVTANWQATQNKNAFYSLKDGEWNNFYKLPAFDSLPDCISLAIDPVDGSAWVGSYGGGLSNVKSDNAVTVYKQNSPLRPPSFAPNSYRVSGLTFDANQNLWVSNYGAPQNLHVRKPDGNWSSFAVPFGLMENAVGPLLVDDIDQKWIIAPNAQGLFCFNHGSSLENTSDDRWKWYREGSGNGGLPDNNVLSIVKDKNNFIWIGTARGIGIVQCPEQIFTSQGCEAILPVVQVDNFPGYLFRDEVVQCMAVDGANRKWVGTKNGVWLISPDGEKTIYRFTSENSPLADNNVLQIALDGITGEVFFATQKGICSFRSTATETGSGENKILVFPNPVPPGYGGTIAVRGVAENAVVKIAELDGRLVYQGRALGGQFVWNGRNYKGERIASGVYLVLVSDDTGKDKMVTKIAFIK